MRSLGPKLKQPLAFQLWLPHVCLSVSWEGGPYKAASLLSLGIRSILCSVSARGHCAALEPSWERSFFSSLSGNATVCVEISHKLPQIVLRVFRPSPYPKDLSYDAARTSLPSPHSPVADANICATSWSSLVVAVRHIFCVLFCF